MSHHEERTRRKAVDEESDFLIDAQIERPDDAIHAACAQPILRRSEEIAYEIDIVRGLEHAEIAECGTTLARVQAIDLRTDAADGVVSPPPAHPLPFSVPRDSV